MKKNIPIFVTHYGCPNQCVFCNQKKISGFQFAQDLEACTKILEEAAQKGYSRENTEIAFFGGSFTGIPLEIQRQYLELAKKYHNYFGGIRLSTRPDYISESILEFLQEYGVTTIELGVQSMVDCVLDCNKRGMKSEATIKAVKLIRKYNFSLGLQMMVSMYGSDRKHDLSTAEKLIALQPDFVRIYPTVVLEDTPLYELYKNGEYQVKSLEETISLTAEIYGRFLKHRIPVIRVGLMSSEEINSKKVIGAYHEAFGELVQGRIYFQEIAEQLSGQNTCNRQLHIYCAKTAVSQVVGQKKENTLKLKENFALRNIKVIPTDELSGETFEIRLELF